MSKIQMYVLSMMVSSLGSLYAMEEKNPDLPKEIIQEILKINAFNTIEESNNIPDLSFKKENFHQYKKDFDTMLWFLRLQSDYNKRAIAEKLPLKTKRRVMEACNIPLESVEEWNDIYGDEKDSEYIMSVCFPQNLETFKKINKARLSFYGLTICNNKAQKIHENDFEGVETFHIDLNDPVELVEKNSFAGSCIGSIKILRLKKNAYVSENAFANMNMRPNVHVCVHESDKESWTNKKLNGVNNISIEYWK